MEISTTAIVNGTLWVLAGCSVATWSVILLKAGETSLNAWRNRVFLRSLDAAGSAVTADPAGPRAPLARVYQAGLKARVRAADAPANGQQPVWHDLLERAMRQQVLRERDRLDTGLGMLASIGSTSPFVGLFGTVWGIMHALQDISHMGSANLEVVAGPIGEALIATALGIAVAVPAVLGYNFFQRRARKTTARLDRFAGEFLYASIEDDLLRPRACPAYEADDPPPQYSHL